jgi:hypothetical protein
MKNGKHVMGICAYTYSDPDYVLMKQAGIEWIRIGFTYPFKDRLHGELNPRFLETVEHVKTLRKKGFKIMGVTPLTGSYRFNKKIGKTVWHPELPEWAGTSTCWQCGQPECPSECGWGLLDVKAKPKLAY